MIPSLLVVVFILFFYFSIIRPYRRWTQKGVRQKSVCGQWVETMRLIFGVNSLAEIVSLRYSESSEERYFGSYNFFKPVLFLRDPELIKQIMIKNFDHFVNRDLVSDGQASLWGKNLLVLKGDRWRNMRMTLSPLFTSSKMRTLFTLIDECSQQLTCYLKSNQTNEIEMKTVFTGYSNSVIASVAFGVTCDSLLDPKNDFMVMGKEVTTPSSFLGSTTFRIMMMSPNLAQLLGLKMFSSKVSQFFKTLVKTSIKLREKNGIVRPDMINLLMEAQKISIRKERITKIIQKSQGGQEEELAQKPLTNDDLTAQALIFFFAGFETVSSILSFLVHELAVNPEVQEKLRREVDKTLINCNGNLTYEDVTKMQYMDMVVSETLRKWPIAIYTNRICVQPYTIQPERKGELPLCIDKNDVVLVPIFGIHRHAEFYSNADKFDPERFSDENKAKINPCTYIPFGVGPRSCIGRRFALLETKTSIIHILSNFEVLVTEKTSPSIKISRNQFNLTSADGFWVKLKPRNDY